LTLFTKYYRGKRIKYDAMVGVCSMHVRYEKMNTILWCGILKGRDNSLNLGADGNNNFKIYYRNMVCGYILDLTGSRQVATSCFYDQCNEVRVPRKPGISCRAGWLFVSQEKLSSMKSIVGKVFNFFDKSLNFLLIVHLEKLEDRRTILNGILENNFQYYPLRFRLIILHFMRTWYGTVPQETRSTECPAWNPYWSKSCL
jgi:hypothetical protein